MQHLIRWFFGRKDISKLINLYLQQQQNLRNTENITLHCVLLSYMRESLPRRRKVGGWSRRKREDSFVIFMVLKENKKLQGKHCCDLDCSKRQSFALS